MDRVTRAALASLNAQLEKWELPQLERLPKPPQGVSPIEYVLMRGLEVVHNLRREDMTWGGNQVRWWDPTGLLHVWELPEALRQFDAKWQAGGYAKTFGRPPRQRRFADHAGASRRPGGPAPAAA